MKLLKFWWWDDAVAMANRRASVTGRRHQVFRFLGVWWVAEADYR